MKKILLLLLLVLPAATIAQSINGFWFLPDSIRNNRMVFAVDSLFLLSEITLKQSPELQWAELEGIIMEFDTAGNLKACVDYLQRREIIEGENGLMIYEEGCTIQKYKTASWSFTEDDSLLILTLIPWSRDAQVSTIRYKVLFPEKGILSLKKTD